MAFESGLRRQLIISSSGTLSQPRMAMNSWNCVSWIGLLGVYTALAVVPPDPMIALWKSDTSLVFCIR